MGEVDVFMLESSVGKSQRSLSVVPLSMADRIGDQTLEKCPWSGRDECSKARCLRRSLADDTPLYALFVEKIVVRLAQQSLTQKVPGHRTFQIEHAKYQGRLLRLLADFRYRWKSGSSSLPEGKRKRKL